MTDRDISGLVSRTESRTDAEPMTDGGAVLDLVIEQGRLSQLLDTVGSLVDECRIHCESDGLHIAAVDPANVAMIEVRLAADGCETFTARDGAVLGLNISRLSEAVGLCDSELVSLTWDPDGRQLEVTGGGFEAELAGIDPDSIRDEPTLPDIDWPARFEVSGEGLASGVAAAAFVANRATIRAAPDAEEVVVVADGDTDSSRVRLTGDGIGDGLAAVDSVFSLSYCEDLISPIPDDAAVTVDLADDMPTRWQWSFADGTGEVSQMLAPRVEGR